ncbi:MFS transporter [Herbaspirillum huttiense]|uniref:MFS transporter n=1 Tax=Herbaspirillum huttiense TaxID=863372 RepID=UPI000417C50D|nr:MFS transporter [Herbaspirillum huttiense]
MQSATPIQVSEVIDARPVGMVQWSAIGTCILIAVLDGFDTQTIGMLAPAMSRELGIPMARFGPIFSAGLLGMLVGAMILGPLADRFGRKTMVIASTLAFGSMSLLTALAASHDDLLLLRFLTGIGLGGALPNALALASEYSPRRHARVIVATLMCGMPLGAVLGGIVTSLLLPSHGWHAVFIVGGALPIAVALFALVFMPESARFLLVRGKHRARLQALMRRIAPELGADQDLAAPPPQAPGVPVAELFRHGRWKDTVLLWIPYFMNLVVLYFIVSWMPAVLMGAHHPVTVGITAISCFSAGGVLGSLLQGWLMNALGVRRTLVLELALYALLALGLANWPQSEWNVIVASSLMGVVIQGAQAGLNVLATEIYPTAMRATGIGFALGIGRIGSICGPLAGSLMLGWQMDVKHIFLMGITPAVIAGLAIVFNRRAETPCTD